MYYLPDENLTHQNSALSGYVSEAGINFVWVRQITFNDNIYYKLILNQTFEIILPTRKRLGNGVLDKRVTFHNFETTL